MTGDARQAHPNGQIPRALGQVAPDLLASDPEIRTVDIIAVKQASHRAPSSHDDNVGIRAVEDANQPLVIVTQPALALPDGQQAQARAQPSGDEFAAQDPIGLAGSQQDHRHDQRHKKQHEGLRRARPQSPVLGDPVGVQRDSDEQQPGEGTAGAPGHHGKIVPASGRGHATRSLVRVWVCRGH